MAIPVLVCLLLPMVAMTLVWIASAQGGFGWGTPTIITTDYNGDTDRPDVAVDPAGNAIAVWHQHDGSRYNLWANRFVPGTGWGTATMIETDNAGHASYPYMAHVVIDASGNALAVWAQHDGSRYNIVANRYVPGTGWGTASLIETDNAGEAIEPQVAISPGGEAVAVWQHHDGTRYNVWANRFLPATGWGPASLIETDAGQVQLPHVAVDDAGNAIAVWQQAGALYNIWANRFVPGTGWGTATLIESDDTGEALQPRVAVDPSGNAVAVWHQSDGSRYNIWANWFVPGTGWGIATLIETDNASHAAFPYPGARVDVDASGNAIAVWAQSDTVRYNIWANRYVAGTGWGTPTLIETDNMGFAYEPQVSMSPSGEAMVVWFQDDAYPRYNVWANRFVPGTGWSPATLIENDDNANHAWTAQVAMDVAGNAVAVWRQYIGARYVICANRFAKDTIPPVLVLTSPTDDVTNAVSVDVAGITEPGASVTVNGVPTSVTADGTFTRSVALVEGVNAITVRSTDSEQNYAERTVSVTSDTLSPALAIDSPLDGAILGSNVVRVTGTATDGGSGVEALSVNGIFFVPSSPWTVDLVLQEGAQTLVVTASDHAGNPATTTRTVTIDTAAPSLAVSAPPEGPTNIATVAVSGTMEPGATVTIDGNPPSLVGGGSFSSAITLPDGEHTFVIVATDLAGNAATERRTVTVDTLAPTLALTGPTNNTSTGVSTVVVSGTTEPGAWVVVNGLVASTSTGGSFSVRVALASGSNTITATSTDAAGNVASRSVFVTYVDPIPGLQQDLQDALDSLASLGTGQAAVRDDLNGALSRLDAAGLQSLLLLVLLIALVGLNVFQILRSRPPRAPKPVQIPPPPRRTDEVPEEWREDAGSAPVEHTLEVEPSAADDAASRMANLDAMRAEGLLSDEEYQARRREILGHL